MAGLYPAVAYCRSASVPVWWPGPAAPLSSEGVLLRVSDKRPLTSHLSPLTSDFRRVVRDPRPILTPPRRWVRYVLVCWFSSCRMPNLSKDWEQSSFADCVGKQAQYIQEIASTYHQIYQQDIECCNEKKKIIESFRTFQPGAPPRR